MSRPAHRAYPTTAWWLVACAAAVLPATAIGMAVAPDGTAAAHAAGRLPQPVPGAGVGGPLAVPSIGVVGGEAWVATEVATTRPATSSRPAQRPQEPPRTVGGSPSAPPAPTGAPSPALAAGNAIPVTPPPPETTAEAPTETTTAAATTTETPPPTTTEEPDAANPTTPVGDLGGSPTPTETANETSTSTSTSTSETASSPLATITDVTEETLP